MRQLLFDMSGVYSQEGFLPEGASVLNFKDLQGTNCYCSDDSALRISTVLSAEDADLRCDAAFDPENRPASAPAFGPAPELRWIDTGDYHYLSAINIQRISEPFALLHLDHHPDMQESAFAGAELLQCGGWVRSALVKSLSSDHYLRRVVAVGINPDLASEFQDLAAEGISAITSKDLPLPGQSFDPLLETLDSSIPVNLPVYISLDLDVLRDCDFATDWDAGNMSIDLLESILCHVLSTRHVVGLDICGGLTREKGASDADLALNLSVRKRLISLLSSL